MSSVGTKLLLTILATLCCSKQKKGIKSSIGRLFGKKEKGRMDQTVSREGQPLPALSGTLQTTNHITAHVHPHCMSDCTFTEKETHILI